MKEKLRLVILGIGFLFVLVAIYVQPDSTKHPSQPPFQAESKDPIFPNLQIEITSANVEGESKQNLSSEQEIGFVADRSDIQQASSEIFPFTHILEDGREWIQTELETYPVIYYTEPMLKNTDIQGLQEILQSLRFYSGQIDGIFGPMTQNAVQVFQKQYGLNPTGIVDLDDYNLLARLFDEARPVFSKTRPTGKVTLLAVLDECSLYVFEDQEIFHRFPIAVGKKDTPSPIGSWTIISKDAWGEGFGTRWLGINVPYGKFGIHGTNKPWSVGRAKSHGCFRMFNRDVEILYNWVTWGTRLYVVGGEFPYNIPWRVIDSGDRGSDVWEVQNRLRELGYYPWKPDGVFGAGTKNAVMKFQKEHHLQSDGRVSWSTLHEMGLYLFQ